MNKEQWNKLTQQEKAKQAARINRKIQGQRDIVVGDLVRIGPWCKNKFRLCHVTDVAWYDKRNITIQYLDAPGLALKPSQALSDNLELILPEEQSSEGLGLPKQRFRNPQLARNTRVGPYLPYHHRD